MESFDIAYKVRKSVLNMTHTGKSSHVGSALSCIDILSILYSNEINLDKNKWHTIDIVVDRLIMNESIDKDRLTNSVETSLKLSNGLTVIAIDSKTELKFSENFSCPDCNISLEEIEPRNFSFNSDLFSVIDFRNKFLRFSFIR